MAHISGSDWFRRQLPGRPLSSNALCSRDSDVVWVVRSRELPRLGFRRYESGSDVRYKVHNGNNTTVRSIGGVGRVAGVADRPDCCCCRAFGVLCLWLAHCGDPFFDTDGATLALSHSPLSRAALSTACACSAVSIVPGLAVRTVAMASLGFIPAWTSICAARVPVRPNPAAQ